MVSNHDLGGIMETSINKSPYKCHMHYDSTIQGVWIGFGKDLKPVCGQSEWIGVTDNVEMVECLKCLEKVTKTKP